MAFLFSINFEIRSVAGDRKSHLQNGRRTETMAEAERRWHPGLAIALAFHLLLFMIPVSTFVVQRLSQIELFVMEEEKPFVQEKVAVKKRVEIPPEPIIPEVIKEPEMIQLPEVVQRPGVIQAQEKAVEQPVVELKVIEPTVKSDKGSLPSPPPVVSSPSPTIEVQVIPSPQSVVTKPVEKAMPLQEVEFGGGNGPRFLHREMPVYPLFARRLGKEGRVILRLTIDEQGKLLNIEVLENPGYGFADSAIDAVRKSTFIPAQKEGKPFAVKAILPIRFALRRGE